MRRAVVEESDGRTTLETLDGNGIKRVVTPLREWQTERARDFVWGLAGAVALLLALAVASSATLLVGRAEGRTQELRVRRALGAGRRRLTAHLLADPVVLCTLAAALPVTWTTTEALREASALELPRIEAVPLSLIAATGCAGSSCVVRCCLRRAGWRWAGPRWLRALELPRRYFTVALRCRPRW